MSNLPERLRVNSCRYAHETEGQAAVRRIKADIEAANEIEQLRAALEAIDALAVGIYPEEKIRDIARAALRISLAPLGDDRGADRG